MHFCSVSRQQQCRIEGIFWTGMELSLCIMNKKARRYSEGTWRWGWNVFNYKIRSTAGGWEEIRCTESKRHRRCPRKALANPCHSSSSLQAKDKECHFSRTSQVFCCTIDCLQSTARLLYMLGIIKNREGCFGPEVISKVFQQSWQTLKHDRVSEIHQNVMPSFFWGGGRGGGPPISRSVVLKREKDRQRKRDSQWNSYTTCTGGFSFFLFFSPSGTCEKSRRKFGKCKNRTQSHLFCRERRHLLINPS